MRTAVHRSPPERSSRKHRSRWAGGGTLTAATRAGFWRMWPSCDLGGTVAAGTRAWVVLALWAVVSRCWRQWLPLGAIP